VGGDLHSGQFQWNDVEAGEDSSRHVVLKKGKKNPTTGVKKATTESYGININYE
jgi:hypothetical protein